MADFGEWVKADHNFHFSSMAKHQTRLHSSRGLLRGGVPALGGVCLGGVSARGGVVSAPGGGVAVCSRGV